MKTMDKKRSEKVKKYMLQGDSQQSAMMKAGYSKSYSLINGLSAKNKQLSNIAQQIRSSFHDRFTQRFSELCTPEQIADLVSRWLNNPEIKPIEVSSLLRVLPQYMKLNTYENVSLNQINNFFLPKSSGNIENWEEIKSKCIEVESANDDKK